MSESSWVYVSSKRATVLVRVERGRIVEGPPITRRYKELAALISHWKPDRVCQVR